MGDAGLLDDWRVAAADPARRIAWPERFGTRFTVFVDVEEEFDWTAPFDRSARATTAIAALPDAHRRFADRGVGLTCLIDYPIATDPRAVAILALLAEDGRSAIGTQLHPWVNPPFDEPLTPANSYVGNLSRPLHAAKLDILTDAITQAFGRPPRAYRAGRYGIGRDTLELLAARGYALDSSIRPGYDYGADGGPDFTAIDAQAFRAGSEDAIVTLPLTTVFTGLCRSGGGPLYRTLGRVPKARGAFSRSGLLNRVALTPEDVPIALALEAVQVAVGEGQRLLNFSFHSPSLVPGNTPYVRDAADLARFHRWWSTMLDRLDRLGVTYASLDAILAAASPGLPPGRSLR